MGWGPNTSHRRWESRCAPTHPPLGLRTASAPSRAAPRSGASFQHGCVLRAKLSVPRAKLRARVTPRPLRRFNDAYGGCCALVQVLKPVANIGDRRLHRQPATGRLPPQVWSEPCGLLTRLLQLYKQQIAVCSSRDWLEKGRRMSRAVLRQLLRKPFTDATTS